MNLETVLSKYEPVIGIEIHAQLKTKAKHTVVTKMNLEQFPIH